MTAPPSATEGSLGAPTDVRHMAEEINPALADRQEACHPHQVRGGATSHAGVLIPIQPKVRQRKGVPGGFPVRFSESGEGARGPGGGAKGPLELAALQAS
jgi:hypothetical protein